jgi:hypothetical protein
MKSAFAALSICLAGCATMETDSETEAPASVADLIGTWDVSLYFSPDQPPSSTTMVITGVEDGVLTGTFYGSPFTTGRATVFDDEVIFTVATEDGSGPYLTSGELEDEEIEGQTLSVGRDFLMAWEAERAE